MTGVLLTQYQGKIVGPVAWVLGHLMNGIFNVLNAIGRSDLFMKVDFSKVPIKLIILIITIPISVEAIVIGFFITCVICFVINAYMPGKIFGYGVWKQLKDWRLVFLSVAIMSIVVWLYTLLIVNKYALLIGGMVIGALVYLGCCLLFKMIDESILNTVKEKVGFHKR